MEFSMRRVNALFKKEVKDFGKNMNVLLMCALPIMFSFIYSNTMTGKEVAEMGGKSYVLAMCVGMNLAMVSTFVIAMLIAEEKEKNTLRTLMLSAVSPWEFLAGKFIISLLLSEIINIAVFFIFGMDSQYLLKYIIVTTVVVVIMMEIGSIIGIVSQNQMATGVVGMPVIMVFLLIPTFAKVNPTLEYIAKILPNYNMNLILEKVFSGKTIGADSIYSIGIILAWIFIAGGTFAYAYNKKGLDK